MFQWDDNISHVSIEGQHITFFNGMTTDHFLQWDDNKSLISMEGHQITCFNGMTT